LQGFKPISEKPCKINTIKSTLYQHYITNCQYVITFFRVDYLSEKELNSSYFSFHYN